MSEQIVVQLYGTQFVQSAVEASEKFSVVAIKEIKVYNASNDSIAALKAALLRLKKFVVSSGYVSLHSLMGLPDDFAASLRNDVGVPVQVVTPKFNNVAITQMSMSDKQQAQTIQTRTADKARKMSSSYIHS